MTPHEFIRRWRNNRLTERASAQSHFNDLCNLLEHQTPQEFDPTGEIFAFEKGATKLSGGEGFADVWKKGHFAFEYKKSKRDLGAAMLQLMTYAGALEHPPIHIASDTISFRIETRFTNTVTKRWEFDIEGLLDDDNLAVLRAAFHEPESLRPKETRESLTRKAADRFQKISDRLQDRYPDQKEAVAHFVNQLVFCFFANSVKLLPEGFWKKLLVRATERPKSANGYLVNLFNMMSSGGDFDLENIRRFNGGLFDGRAPLELNQDDFHLLLDATNVTWGLIDPTIFGTLFERFLDPDKRAQIGAHYTDPDKIMLIIEPVILRPLRAEWLEAKATIEAVMQPALESDDARKSKKFDTARLKAEGLRDVFLKRLAAIKILDPACGSGNFLYIALQVVKDLEWKAISECEALGLGRVLLGVGPRILHGIEINALAAELARTVIWIGDIQWGIRNGLTHRPDPILEKLDTIDCRDALVKRVVGASFETPSTVASQDEDNRGSHAPEIPHAEERLVGASRSTHGVATPAQWIEAPWPKVDFIVGNPPFLGGKKLRNGSPPNKKNPVGTPGLGDVYVDTLFSIYDGRVPREADLVCYWFEKAWAAKQAGRVKRVGFVSTNSIRGGKNRAVLAPIAVEGQIFEAWSDEPWVVDGASVRVSLVCFGDDDTKRLDGKDVAQINGDLSSDRANVSTSQQLNENTNVAFQGPVLVGEFEIEGETARSFLDEPLNPNGRPNSDVVLQFLNGKDIVQNGRDFWVIDFKDRTEQQATLYQNPFERIRDVVRPQRQNNNRVRRRNLWWRHGDLVPSMWEHVLNCTRVIFTPRVSKHRLFVWGSSAVLPDSAIVTIARDDDTTFGILHSRFHEAWSLRLGTSLENRPRYTPTTTFETFPFPEGLTPNIPSADYAADPRAIRIAEAASRLDELRCNWLYPADLGDWTPEIIPTAPPGEAPRQYPDRFIAKTIDAQLKLKERTLTNLYNKRPQWLADAHATLDKAVAAAYGWAEDIGTDKVLERLLALNLERAGQGR